MAFEKGNKLAQEWNIENATPRFDDAIEYAETNEDCLCLQDAIHYSAIPYTTFYYLSENHDVLNAKKKQIMEAIIRRINRLAIKNDAPAAAAIWRMKQLGERDEQHINQTVSGKQEITVTDAETLKAAEELKAKFESES